MSRLNRIWGALSQLGNVVLFNGHPNESISARCHREGKIGRNPIWLSRRDKVNWLFSRREDDHCYNAYLTDKKWAEELINARNK